MTEPGAVAGVVALAAAGLLALYYRLRVDFDRSASVLTLVMLAGASPLLAVMVQRRLADAAWFAALALATLGLRLSTLGWPVQIVVMAMVVAMAPMLAQSVSPQPTLFSSANGFLALTPVVYVAVIGLAASLRTHRAEGVAMLAGLIMWPWLEMSPAPLTALAAAGLAVVIQFARQRPVIAALPLVLAAIVWNYWLMVQYTAGTVPKDAPVSFAAMVRQQADVHTRAEYVYPFALPFTVVMAWREGIPIGRYDQLAVEPQRDTFEMRFDGTGDRFLLDGWGAIGSSAAGPFRAIAADRARMVFPLRPSEGGVELTVLVSLAGDAAANDAEAQIEINNQRVGRFLVAAAPSEVHLRVAAADVGRIFRTGYNRLSIVPSAPARIAIHRLRLAPIA